MDFQYWETFYDLENVLDYWEDNIDHAFVSFADWQNV
jgi:hypothetical protein